MRDKTLGFDPTTSTLHIWTKGLTKDEAKAWVGEGAEATPLVRLPGGRFAQSVTLGSETRTLALVAPEVPPTLAKAPSGAVDVGDLPRFGSSAGYRGPGRVSFGAGASTRRLDWLLYGTGPLTEVGDGFLPLFEGTSGRVVLDGRGDLFVARPATLDERIAEELFRAVQIPVRASDGEFLIDGTATMRDSDYDSIVGKPIVGIGGVKLSSVLNDWRSGNRRRVFESLVRWRREGFDLSVMRDASKDERVGVPIPPDPLMGGR